VVDLTRAVEADVTFAIADLSGFTALTETHGNLYAARVVRRYVEIVADVLDPGARLLERAGDGILVVANTAASAVRSAVALTDAIEGEPLFPLVRVGAHGGMVVELDGAYFGTALNLTARLAAHARPGQLLCTERVTVASARLEGLAFRPLGPVRLKNILNPVPVFEVVSTRPWDGRPSVDPVCRMRVDPETAPARLPLADRTYYFCSQACAGLFAERPEDYAPP
jgi:adenylate cyclase